MLHTTQKLMKKYNKMDSSKSTKQLNDFNYNLYEKERLKIVETKDEAS